MSRGPLLGGLTAVLGGFWTLLTGLTDFGWILANTDFWYPVITTATRFIGPQFAPQLPWSLVTMLAGGAFVVVLLIRGYRKRKEKHA